MNKIAQAEQVRKIARSEVPVFFLKRAWVHEYWDHLVRDPEMPKRDSPDEWCAAVDRGEVHVLGAMVVFLESVTGGFAIRE